MRRSRTLTAWYGRLVNATMTYASSCLAIGCSNWISTSWNVWRSKVILAFLLRDFGRRAGITIIHLTGLREATMTAGDFLVENVRRCSPRRIAPASRWRGKPLRLKVLRRLRAATADG